MNKEPRNVALQGREIQVSLRGGMYKFNNPDGRVTFAEVRTPWFKKMESGHQYHLFLTGAGVESDANEPSYLFKPTGGPQGVFELVGGVVKSNSGRRRDPMWQ